MRSQTILKKCLFPIMLLCFIFLIGLAITWRIFLFHPLSSSEQVVNITVKSGSSANKFILKGKQVGLFNKKSAFLFKLFVYFFNQQNNIQAGEYLFNLNDTPKHILDKLIRGDVVQHKIQIIEGWTAQDFFQALHEQPELEFNLSELELKTLSLSLGCLETAIEGCFFPDTYFFSWGTKAVKILHQAHQKLLSHLQKSWETRDKSIVLKTPYEALILSSIIEKETHIDIERSIVSGVFQRRLRLNMPLQADPTVIYGLRKELHGDLTRDYLLKNTPYNTYIHKGLPPTPIALPGLKSIQAAMHPDHSQLLYFVAKGDGSHYFSSNIESHQKAVKKYQTGKRHAKSNTK